MHYLICVQWISPLCFKFLFISKFNLGHFPFPHLISDSLKSSICLLSANWAMPRTCESKSWQEFDILKISGFSKKRIHWCESFFLLFSVVLMMDMSGGCSACFLFSFLFFGYMIGNCAHLARGCMSQVSSLHIFFSLSDSHAPDGMLFVLCVKQRAQTFV